MKLYQLHKKYLFNTVTIFTTIGLLFIGIIFSFSLIHPFLNRTLRWMNRVYLSQNFEQAYFSFVKMISICFSSYLFGSAFTQNHDNYYLVLIGNVSKIKYFYTKIVAIALQILEVISVLFLNYILIQYSFNQWYIISGGIFLSFVVVYLLSIIYGLLSIIVICPTHSIYSLIIIFGIYLTTEIIVDYDVNTKFIKCMALFFPTTYYKNQKFFLEYGYFQLLIILILYSFIGYLVYRNKE